MRQGCHALVVVAKNMAYSLFFHLQGSKASANVADLALSTPVLIFHGTEDNCIPGGTTGAQLARDKLAGLGVKDSKVNMYDGMCFHPAMVSCMMLYLGCNVRFRKLGQC